MSTQNHDTKLALSAQCTALVQGVNSLPDPTLTLDGKTYSKAAVVAPLNACVAAIAATATAHTAWTQSVQNERDAVAAARAMIAALKPYLRVRLGKNNPALQSEFGVPPAKKTQKTVAVKSTAIAKAKATRVARHTMGPKQKTSVKGAPAPATTATPPAPGAKPSAQ
jgi:hypothetical protein